MARDGQLDFTRSVSQRAKFRECPRKWFLQYMAGWQRVQRKAAWLFGDTMEATCEGIIRGEAQASLLVNSADAAVELFDRLWAPVRMDPAVQWTTGSWGVSWGQYRDRGRILTRMVYDWIHEHLLLKPGTYQLQEEFRYTIGGAREVGYADFRGFGRKDPADLYQLGILDFKAAGRKEPEHLIELDEQLTTYQVGSEMKYPNEPIQWLAHLRMVAVTKPYLQVMWEPRRSEDMVAEFLSGAVLVNQQILAGSFPRNTKACHTWGGCEMQPVCFPSQRERQEKELLQKPEAAGEAAAAVEFEL